VGVAVDGANRNDMKMVEATIESMPVERPKPTPRNKQGMCMDKGYDFDEVREIVREFGFTAHIRPPHTNLWVSSDSGKAPSL
jgi:putative transposase